MPQDPHKINVVVSGSTNTKVKVPTAGNQITVSQQTTDTTVSKTISEQNINVGFMGTQGPVGQLSASSIIGDDGNFLYNRAGFISGSNAFFYYPSGTKLEISDNNLVLGDDATFVLSGVPLDENAFLLRDSNSKNLLRVNTEDKNISLAEGASSTEYYVGIGIDQALERLHVSKGNLRVDGDIHVSGNFLPIISGAFDLGSVSKPFRDIFLKGDSVYFVDEGASIHATASGFSFKISGDGIVREILSITEAGAPILSGIVGGDGSRLTGIPYTGLSDAGAWISQQITSGQASAIVDYQRTLTYDPQVICGLSVPEGLDEYYLVFVKDISRTGCLAEFSAKIDGNGYILNSHVAPRDNPTIV
ncbi:hypothetical protein CL634_03845 [bacterium]|nr:hypothetical protein [bacterium]|tara:strand:+ start:6 stop:1088 length:1083 start_codon:yes stop_codon:yes gene_type:complete